MYLELDVPSNNSSLGNYVSEYLNTSDLVGMKCEDGCKQFVEVEKRSRISQSSETEFIIIILNRVMQTQEGYSLIDNKVSAIENVFIRYFD